MAKRKDKVQNDAQVLLGKNLERLRLKKAITRKQLGRIVKVPEQQIARYENGSFVPISRLEKLMEAMEMQVKKKWIRKISSLRECKVETDETKKELSNLYTQIFEE